MNKVNKWDMMVNNYIATEDELKLVTSILGFNDGALNDVMYVKEGYETVEDYADAELAYYDFIDGDTFTIDFSVVGSIDGLLEALYDKDYILEFDESLYIYDQENGDCYGIENDYEYLDSLDSLLGAGEFVEFYLLDDDEAMMLERNTWKEV